MPTESDEIILLESNSSPESPLYYKIPGVKTIVIAGPDIEFFRQLQKLPAVAKIELMRLNPVDMEAYCIDYKQKELSKIDAFFKAKWKWMETGEPVVFDARTNEYCFNLRLTPKQIITKIKAGKLTSGQVKAIIEFFEEDLYKQVLPVD